MTSADTLGPVTTSNVSTVLPSVTVNSSIPVENGIPQPARSKVSSIEAGMSTSVGDSNAGTYTMTPQQLADRIGNLLQYVGPAMGPEDELPPFARTLRSGQGTIGPVSEPPIRCVTSRYQNPLGGRMGDWRSTADFNSPQPAPSAALTDQPGGLLGMLLDHLRNN